MSPSFAKSVQAIGKNCNVILRTSWHDEEDLGVFCCCCNDNHRIEFSLFSSFGLFELWPRARLSRETGSHLDMSSWSSHEETVQLHLWGPRGPAWPSLSLRHARHEERTTPPLREQTPAWDPVSNHRNLQNWSNRFISWMHRSAAVPVRSHHHRTLLCLN